MRHAIKTIMTLCVVVGLGAAGLFGTEYVLDRQGAQASDRGGAARTTPVRVNTPQTRMVEDAVDAVGTVMATRDVALRAIVAGRVAEVAVTSGARVEAGDLILQLDDRSQKARLTGARATLDEARQNLRRIDELAESNTAAEQRLEAARASFRRAESEMMAATAALQDRRIEAPFAGTLGFVDYDPGAYVSPQDVISTLSDLSVVQVDMALPENYFDRVAPGQRVTLHVPAYPNRRYQGTVAVRETRIDTASRSFDIRAEIENDDRSLVAGMFAKARLVFGSRESLAVQERAIIAEGRDTYVYVVSDGTAQRRDVTTGRSLDGLVEITAGLAESDQVVVAGWDTLRDGAPVSISEDVARANLK